MEMYPESCVTLSAIPGFFYKRLIRGPDLFQSSKGLLHDHLSAIIQLSTQPVMYSQVVLVAHVVLPLLFTAQCSPVDKNVASMFDDLLNFVLHLFLLGQLELGDFGDAIDANPRSEHFDLVGVHWSVGDEN